MLMHRTFKYSLMALATVLLLQGSVRAADEDMAAASDSAEMKIFSGGVGDDDMHYIKSVEHQYSAKFLFTEANGDYLSDLPVTITNKAGETVLSTVTKGPVLLVNLPAGQYVVKATEGEVSKQQRFSVQGYGMRSYHLTFPSNDALN